MLAPTEDDLRAFSKHLLYEIEMLVVTMELSEALDRTAVKANANDSDQASEHKVAASNALMESWVL